MADFNVRYRYQSRENGFWSSSSISISTRGDEIINCKDAREYIISKGRYWDAKIINIELRGSRDYFEYNIRFHYQYKEGGSWSSSSMKALWFNDNPGIKDLEELVRGYKYDCYDVHVDVISID